MNETFHEESETILVVKWLVVAAGNRVWLASACLFPYRRLYVPVGGLS